MTTSNPPTQLLAGTASLDITPTTPVAMAGYANRTELSQGVHDRLYARAVAFQLDNQRLILLSADILGLYGGTDKAFTDAIHHAHSLQPGQLLLAAIHTHGGPQVGFDTARLHPNNIAYTHWLQDRLVTLVHQALSNMVPATLHLGTGSSPVGCYRREPFIGSDGKSHLRLGRNPDVLLDRQVQVLRVDRADGACTLAAAFAYATHSTAMGWANLLITSDVHGLAERFIEQHLGNGVIAPGFAGASGDIDPWYRVLGQFNTTNGWVPEAQLMGTMLGEEVVHVLRDNSAPTSAAPIRSTLRTLSLPGKAAPATLTVTAARIGQTAFVGLGGEVFNSIGQAIKAASPFPTTFIITHCNGAAGYIPTADAYPQGGYEIDTTHFAPQAAEQVIAAATEILHSI
jgi:hypothetical protein